MGGQVSQDDRHAINVKADFEGIILVALIMTILCKSIQSASGS